MVEPDAGERDCLWLWLALIGAACNWTISLVLVAVLQLRVEVLPS